MVQFSAFICIFSTILLAMKIGPGFWSRVPAFNSSPKLDFIPNFVTKLLIGYMQMNDIMPDTIQASL